MRRTPLLLLGLMLAFTACQETEPADWTHTVHITQCANPWEDPVDSTDDALKAAVETYLTDQGITVLDIQIIDAPERGAACLACSCAGTKTINIRISEADGAILLGLDLPAYNQWEVYLGMG